MSKTPRLRRREGSTGKAYPPWRESLTATSFVAQEWPARPNDYPIFIRPVRTKNIVRLAMKRIPDVMKNADG